MLDFSEKIVGTGSAYRLPLVGGGLVLRDGLDVVCVYVCWGTSYHSGSGMVRLIGLIGVAWLGWRVSLHHRPFFLKK